MQENPSYDDPEVPVIKITDKPVSIPDHFEFQSWTHEQRKAFFETPERLKPIKQKVKNTYGIPEENQTTTLDSPWHKKTLKERILVYRIADSSADPEKRFPDIITVSIKLDEKGKPLSLPETEVLRSDRSAKTRSAELQEALDLSKDPDLELQ